MCFRSVLTTSTLDRLRELDRAAFTPTGASGSTVSAASVRMSSGAASRITAVVRWLAVLARLEVYETVTNNHAAICASVM